jgi:hypothetical protein
MKVKGKHPRERPRSRWEEQVRDEEIEDLWEDR